MRPLVSLTIGWISGVFVYELLGNQWIFYILCLLGSIGTGIWLKLRYNITAQGCLVLLGIAISAIRLFISDGTNNSDFLTPIALETGTIVGKGKIDSVPIMDGNRMRFEFELREVRFRSFSDQGKTEKIQVTVQLQNKSEWQRAKQITRGMIVQLPIQLKELPKPRNPGEFDYGTYLKRHHIFWLGKVSSLQEIVIIGKEESIWTWIDQIHTRLAKQLEQLYSKPIDGFMKGLILGDRLEVPLEWEQIYQDLGIVHILSISGFHVSLLFGAFYFFLKSLGLTREKAAWIVILFIPIYVMLVGAEPPVIRAGIMAGFMMFAICIRKETDLLSVLCLSAIIQLMWNPYQIYEAGFQLSYIVTAGLIVGVEPLSQVIPVGGQRVRYAISAGIVAQLVSVPIIISHFYECSLLAFPVNLLFAPVFSIGIIPLATLGLSLSFLSFPLGNGFSTLASYLTMWIQMGADWFSRIPYTVITVPPPSVIWMILYLLVTSFLWMVMVGERVQKRVWQVSLSICLLGLISFAFWGHIWFRDRHEVTMIDVGQGDSLLIQTKQGKVILIDGGGNLPQHQQDWQKRRNPFEVGEDILVPFLKYKGIREIDYMIATHGDADHIGGLQAVVDRFPIGTVLRNPLAPHSLMEQRWMKSLSYKKVPVQAPDIGDQIQVEEGVRLTFLHPNLQNLTESREKTNNVGVVVLVELDQTKLLLMADVEKEVEEQILKYWDLPKIDILKVAHHGSKTSSTSKWLEEVQPVQALISVGENNRYGHPSPEVLQRLEQKKTKIWRTDQHGAIMIYVHENTYQIDSVFR